MKPATLRVCMHCEWIYKGDPTRCPLCTWPSYGAHYAYGDKAYRLAITQEPWKKRKLDRLEEKLNAFIERRRNAHL